MKLTWVDPLSTFHRRAIDWAFRDYLSNGEGEYFDVHAITKRCKLFMERQEGDKPGLPRGCAECRWSGWIYVDQQMNRVTKCRCRRNPELQTPRPLFNLEAEAKKLLAGRIDEMPKMPSASTADGDTEQSESLD